MTPTRQLHPSHPKHELEWVNRQKSYKCDGCKEGGFGPRYRCDRCDYDLHEACMFPKSPTTHDFFKERSFKFFDRPQGNGERYCDACGRDIEGFVYHCKEANLDFHPCCVNLTRVIKVGVTEFRICEEEAPSKCCYCEKKNLGKDTKGRSYASTCENSYYLHVACVTKMIAENSKKDYFRSGDGDNENCLVLKNRVPDRRLSLNRSSKGGKKSRFWKIAEIVLSTLTAILFGNPTPVIINVLLLALNP
ncbi:hypothetical protein HHK36_010981 [Tetracentron sinense]|uniref:DC1 domain-containing protein n=1 Tax=Tetracentron sinense TaxID=13715 RepID=A0A835DK22_TETSI|nr:hypothetical protein HHK36_010981 [Tetracentron sinense]